jgi:glycosyltransferase involved in cell wall biosynthesis
MVRGQEPTAKLVIVGRHPPDGLLLRVIQAPGVELHPDVADVRPYLGESGVMTVPLRIGGGSRLKILEALACGLPVVSTKVGAEGLLLKPGEDYVQAEEDAMASALVHAIRNPSEMLAMAEHARKLVLDVYDWSVLARKLESSWEKSISQP